MESRGQRALSADPEWQTLAAGAGGAIAVLLAGAMIGIVEGNLLPGTAMAGPPLHRDRARPFRAGVSRLAGRGCGRGAGPPPLAYLDLALWALRILAVLGWAPVVWLVALVFG